MTTALTRQQKYENVRSLTRRTVASSAMTIASHGLNPDKFADVITEALLLNPDLLDCTEQSLAQSLRRCCQDGLVPNGREAAITIFQDRRSGQQQATYMPMKEGLARIAWETLGAEIHAGVVYEGDDVRVTQGAGVMQTVEVFGDPFRADKGPVKGAYAWCKLPMENYPRLVTMNREEIEKRRDASFAKERGPWGKWFAEMAQKSAIKRLVTEIRHLFASTGKSARLLQVLDADDVAEANGQPVEIIDVEAVPVQPEVQPAKDETPAQAEAPSTAAAQEDDIPETPPPATNGQQTTFLPQNEATPANDETAI